MALSAQDPIWAHCATWLRLARVLKYCCCVSKQKS